jgi:uracil-DNA glycosylase
MNEVDKTEEMKKIRDEVIGLVESPLYEYRVENNYHAVLGEGNHDAEIVFVGEAPGKSEAQSGRPFCGRAGNLLDELLESIGVLRGGVYITNIVKDRPPNNRDPHPEEIAIYAPFLDRQLEVIGPKVIATLGRYAMEYMMKTRGLQSHLEPISTAHGKQYSTGGLFGNTTIIPLYHPAAAIYTQSLKDTLFEDFKILKSFV